MRCENRECPHPTSRRTRHSCGPTGDAFSVRIPPAMLQTFRNELRCTSADRLAPDISGIRRARERSGASAARAGLAPGDRLCMLGRNHLRYAHALLCGVPSGIILVPLNYNANTEELRYIIEDAVPKAIAISTEFSERVAPPLLQSLDVFSYGANFHDWRSRPNGRKPRLARRTSTLTIGLAPSFFIPAAQPAARKA